MRNMGIVHGSAGQAKPLIIGKDTVYVHSDIEKVEMEDGSESYQYNEIQYEKDEYIRIMAEQNESMESDITNLQLALCDLYESTL